MSNLLIYQSSAGSGKTYKLAKEYIKLAFKYPGAFKSILAITFTNKATEEMKSRVLKFLIDLSGEKDEKLLKQLLDEGVDVDIKESAKTILSNILHNYSDFSISTIDSFFNRVLRSFSKELKLQIGYDIELDQNKVLKEITEMMLKGIKDDEDLKKYLSDFMLMKISEDKGWDIERDFEKLGREIFKERYWEKKFNSSESGSGTEISDSREKVKILISDISKIVKDFENYLKNIGSEAETVLKNYGLAIEDFSNKDKGVMGFLINKLKYSNDYELTKRAISAFEENEGWYAKTSKKKEDIQKAVDGGLYALLKNAVEFIKRESPKYNTAKELKNTIYTLGIFEDLNARLNDYRKINRKLLQSDVNSILQGIISDDNSPFIYEKIGNNYKNILVDEFQDTSTFQWKNLLPLIINVLSERNIALVAGDVKQSIYRWRSGNMKLLLSQIYKDLDGFREVIKTDYLKTNRRSKKKIVEFNNSFFQYAADKIIDGIDDDRYKVLIKKAYSKESVEQEFEKQGGYVNIKFFNVEKDSETSASERADEKVKEIVSEVLKDGYNLSDILVLVRANEEAKRISGVLTNAGHSIVSTESLMVNNSPKVRMIVDLMKYIADNKNELAKADAVYNYVVNIAKENPVYNEIFEAKGGKFTVKMPKEFFKENEFPKIKPILNDTGVYEVCENLVIILGFNNISDPYLIKFQDLILEYTKENNSDLKSFIDWWDEKKNDYTIDSPEGTNAIRIMTIHKAKGLQGKIVIVPYANWKLNIDGTKDLIWVSSEQEPFGKSSAYAVKATLGLRKTYFAEDFNYEFAQTRLDNLNLLYVTFTRAEERLYVLVPEKKNTENTGKLIRGIINDNYVIENDEFESGEKEKKEIKEEEVKVKTETLKYFISNDWYKKTIIKPKYRAFKEITDTDFAYKLNRGVVIHEVLSRLKSFENSDEVINEIVFEGIISENDAGEIKEEIERLSANSLIKKWFSDEWEVKKESEILLKDGSILRPDRVLIKGNEAIVIDYKTGIAKDEHKEQITKYAETLVEMGYSVIKKYLLYVGRKEEDGIDIIEVTG